MRGRKNTLGGNIPRYNIHTRSSPCYTVTDARQVSPCNTTCGSTFLGGMLQPCAHSYRACARNVAHYNTRRRTLRSPSTYYCVFTCPGENAAAASTVATVLKLRLSACNWRPLPTALAASGLRLGLGHVNSIHMTHIAYLLHISSAEGFLFPRCSCEAGVCRRRVGSWQK